jgi:L-ascorbate metabolism protein UlaG (beta-lactamase superfamily)
MKKKRMVIVIIVSVLVVSIVAINMFFRLSPQFGGHPDKQRLIQLAGTSLYDGRKFKNEVDKPVIQPHSFRKILKLQFRKNPGRFPLQPLPSIKPVFNINMNDESISIIWLGHSSVFIRMGNTLILTDPVFSKRASPVSFTGPMSFPLTVPYFPEELPIPDIILISHDHFDHLDYKTIKQYYLKVKTFLVPLGVRDHLERWGVPAGNITEFDWGESLTTDAGLQFIAKPAQHFSGRRRQENATLWCSWIIMNKSHKVFFCGDSGYGPHFKQIGEQYGPFDITLIECGAYGQYWPNIHMLPEQSVQAHIDLGGRTLMPVHWGKFNLAFHPWKEPVERMTIAASERNIDIRTPIIGEELMLQNPSKSDEWWKKIE